MGNLGSRHQRLFKENIGKTKKDKECSWKWQPLIEYAKNKMTFNYLSSLENMHYILLYFLLFRKGNQFFLGTKGILFFLVFFFGWQGICPHSYVSPGALRKSNLCSSL